MSDRQGGGRESAAEPWESDPRLQSLIADAFARAEGRMPSRGPEPQDWRALIFGEAKRVMLNANTLARQVADREGGKVNLPIAQIKEVMRLLLEELARVPASVALELIERHRGAPDPGKADWAPGQPEEG
jgi:hypothetical protein